MAEYLYVCHFSNGHIKVGRSIDPASRIATHADRVACLGVTLVDQYVSISVDDGVLSEAALIARCAQCADKQHKNEWFVGLDFLIVTQWVKECAAMIHEDVRATPLKAFLFGLTMGQRQGFALSCNTSVGHLTNCAYGYAPPNPALCVSIERESGGKVTRQEMRDDWQAIWPELVAKTFTRSSGEVVTDQRKA